MMSTMKSGMIYLIGSMGAGKSTIGQLLAKELGLSFADTDKEIEARCGADISWIFDVEGEEGFRKRETTVLRDLSQQTAQIIATGGGTVMTPENRQIIRDGGFVVFLDAAVDTLIRRMEKDRCRPLLQRPDRNDVIKDLHVERDPVYRELADLIVLTSRESPRLVVKKIIDTLNQYLPRL